MTSTKPGILFYSRTCKTCAHLISILQSEGLFGYFNLFCVDDNIDKLPKYVTEVPLAIIKTFPKPLVSKEIFQWIQSVKQMRQQFIEQKQAMYIEQMAMAEALKKAIPDLQGFDGTEMAGQSDSYAYKDFDAAMPHEFMMYRDDEKHAIFTAPLDGKLSKTDQEARIRDIEKKREEQQTQYADAMKREQIERIASKIM